MVRSVHAGSHLERAANWSVVTCWELENGMNDSKEIKFLSLTSKGLFSITRSSSARSIKSVQIYNKILDENKSPSVCFMASDTARVHRLKVDPV